MEIVALKGDDEAFKEKLAVNNGVIANANGARIDCVSWNKKVTPLVLSLSLFPPLSPRLVVRKGK